MIEFYREKGYWPTAKEVDIYVRFEKDHSKAKYSGGNYVKPRITEMTESSDRGPDLLEYAEERDQEYCERAVRGDVDGIPEEEFDGMTVGSIPSAHAAKPLEDVEDEVDRSEGDDTEDVQEDGEDSVIVSEEPSDDDDSGDGVGEKSEDRELKDPEEIDAPDTDVEVDLDTKDTEEQEEDSPEPGDLLYGGDDQDDDKDSQDEEDDGDGSVESMTLDGVEYTKNEDEVWISEDGGEYVFPPGKDESDFDSDKYGSGSTSGEDSSLEDRENHDDSDSGEDQASLNQTLG